MCPLPFPMTSVEAKRYRAWQRMQRKLRRLDRYVMSLRMLIVRSYNAELAEINSVEGPDGSGEPYAISEHFEEERWRRT